MNAVAKRPTMIYNVYQGGGDMNVSVAKWGNSLGIRIPVAVSDSMGIRTGDSLSYEVRGNEMILRKNISTARMFEDFYKKPFDQITAEDVGPGGEIDWGEDVGGEVF